MPAVQPYVGAPPIAALVYLAPIYKVVTPVFSTDPVVGAENCAVYVNVVPVVLATNNPLPPTKLES